MSLGTSHRGGSVIPGTLDTCRRHRRWFCLLRLKGYEVVVHRSLIHGIEKIHYGRAQSTSQYISSTVDHQSNGLINESPIAPLRRLAAKDSDIRLQCEESIGGIAGHEAACARPCSTNPIVLSQLPLSSYFFSSFFS